MLLQPHGPEAVLETIPPPPAANHVPQPRVTSLSSRGCTAASLVSRTRVQKVFLYLYMS